MKESPRSPRDLHDDQTATDLKQKAMESKATRIAASLTPAQREVIKTGYVPYLWYSAETAGEIFQILANAGSRSPALFDRSAKGWLLNDLGECVQQVIQREDGGSDARPNSSEDPE